MKVFDTERRAHQSHRERRLPAPAGVHISVTETTELLARARADDGYAFRELTDPYRRELQLHCYRMVGSVQDAEDLVQETLLAVWRGIDRFEERASLRTWLYSIATNRCLNALRTAGRRAEGHRMPEQTRPLPEPSRYGEPSWVEPYPDVLLADLPDRALGPEARYEARESMSLAFVTALQQLPPRQRAVLVLRDVLGLPAAETAELLDSTEHAVHSAVRRARATLAPHTPDSIEATPLPDSPAERKLVERFVDAFESGDVPRIVALLTDDTLLTMPPLPFEYHGREAVGSFLATTCAGPRSVHLVPTRANGQPAFGCYVTDQHNAATRAHGLLVLTVRSNGISALTRFVDNAILRAFGLPRTLTRP
jgi:RNA polymerase sigma-70 factor (TIGR02960 family)